MTIVRGGRPRLRPRRPRLAAACARRAAAEHGVALIAALGIMVVLSMSTVSVVAFASSNERHAVRGVDYQVARSLAEAGLNNAAAAIHNPDNNPLDSTMLPSNEGSANSATYAEGEARWWGTLSGSTWTIFGVGIAANPAGPDLEQRLTATVEVLIDNNGPPNNPAWNYMMSTKTGTTCDMSIGNGDDDGTANVKTRLYVFGNLCMYESALITDGPLQVVGQVTMYDSGNRIGSSTLPVNEVHVGQGCKWDTNPLHNPCQQGSGSSGYDNLWATVLTNTPVNLTSPVADFDAFYLSASPGPYSACTTQSGSPPVWDSPVHPTPGSATDAEKLAYKNNNQASFNLTPTSSYSCTTSDGQLSWDASTKTLTVDGVLYIDGHAKITNNAMNKYDGKGVLYLSGTFYMSGSKLCAVASGSTQCDWSVWDPNAQNGDLLAIVAGGSGGQTGMSTGESIKLSTSQFQGALWGLNTVRFTAGEEGTVRVSGPVIGGEIKFPSGEESTFTAEAFPWLTSVPNGLPGEPMVHASPQPVTNYRG